MPPDAEPVIAASTVTTPHREITYRELHEQVCRFANLLKAQGVKRGERVTIYLPMVPEAAVAMLACARIGAIHSIVFAGFSPDALAGRIIDCDSRIVLTSDEGLRGGKKVTCCATPVPTCRWLKAATLIGPQAFRRKARTARPRK